MNRDQLLKKLRAARDDAAAIGDNAEALIMNDRIKDLRKPRLATMRCDRAEIERLREELHYCNGTCDLAIKHRNVAEATNAEMRALLKEGLAAARADDWRKRVSAFLQKAEGRDV